MVLRTALEQVRNAAKPIQQGLDFNVHHVSFIMKDAALIALVELDHKGVSYSKAVEMAHDAYILKAEAMGSPLETSDRIAIKNHLVDLGFCIN